MDLVRLGLGIRALRRRRGWRQRDLAVAAGMSQGLISLIERGHGDRVSLGTLLAVAGAFDARVAVQLRWRAGDLDRLLDVDHAALSAAMVERLRADGWIAQVEVTYATVRTAGSIDILAWHLETATLLVVEIKTEISSSEAVLRKLDEKARLAIAVAWERFGFVAKSVSRLLVIEDTSTNRRRVAGAEALFASSLPMDGRTIRTWLKEPDGPIAGRLFHSPTNGGSAIRRVGGRHRVRALRPRPDRPGLSVGHARFDAEEDELEPGRTLLVG